MSARREIVGRRRFHAVAVAVAVCMAVCGVWVSPVSASFGVASFDQEVLGSDGEVFSQAGGHPYAISTKFSLRTVTNAIGNPVAEGGNLKDIVADLPAGFVGNPSAMPRCRTTEFLSDPESPSNGVCPGGSQVGIILITIGLNGSVIPWIPVPVYNLEPPPGVAAEFGFNVQKSVVLLDASVRGSDYGVRVRVRNASQVLTVLGSELTLWGVPADPSHDAERVCKGGLATAPGCTTDAPLQAFLTNPTSCGAPGTGLESRLAASSWENPDVFDQATSLSHVVGDPTTQVAISGCGALPFDPSMRATPETNSPDSPTGLSVDLSFPQDGIVNPNGLGTAHLKQATFTLPEGLTISPSSADGLKACSDSEIGLGTNDPIRCPNASKIGTADATTPLLADPLHGGIYVGAQKSDDPESGDMFRIYLVLENEERGLLVKLPGRVRADKTTGRLVAVFANTPQLPVSTITTRFKIGPRSPLATPPTCGSKAITADLASWGGQTANLTDDFTVDCVPGLGAFAPAFTAGTLNPTGGAFSPLVLQIDRPDRQQYLSGLSLDMPDGLIAKLKGVPLCGEAQAAAGTCPLETRIGTTTVGAGPGSNPFFLKGSVSLTGPYKGAPYGLSAAVRALAGPFDLGMVVVRQAIYIDPTTAHLRVISDPLPTIIKGVPVRLRSVAVDVDRPGFTLNPTSCAEKTIKASFISLQGAVSQQSSRFQAAECQRLGFSPKLALRLTGKGQTTDGKHPGIKAVLTQPRGQAAIRGGAVRLPLSLALDPANAVSDTLCEFDEGQKADPKCPKSSIIGRVKAISPILNRPLTGNVYFVKNVRIDKRTGRRIRTLPTLIAALRGEVSLNLRAKTSISRNRLVSTFPIVPDAPVSHFELTLNGGRKGILVVTNGANVCKGKQTASTTLIGHNNKRSNRNVPIATPCAKRTR